MNGPVDHKVNESMAVPMRSAFTTLTRAALWLGRSDTVFALALVAPALIVVVVVLAYPMASGFVLSFRKYDLLDPGSKEQWVGLSHYLTLFRSGLFFQAWANSLVYWAGTVAFQFIVGFGCALLLNEVGRFRNLYRGIYLLPWITPPVAAAALWWWIFELSHGVINLELKHFGLISQSIPWLAGTDLAMLSVMIAVVWRLFPFDMVMLLAGLQTIPTDLLDAAAVDGAGWAQRFRYVVVPHMRNIIVVILVLTSVWSFQEFTMIWGMTKGGPVFATRTLNLFIQQTAFDYFRMGEASAAGVVWLVVLLIFSVVVLRLGLRGEANL